jgi:phospholipid/cholesterol/gamma-HCH transport system substrate-binding protein
MIKRGLTPGRLLAVAGFAFSCFVLLLYLWLRSGGTIPLAPQNYQVHVPLPQAKGLGQHSDVRVSGVTVGHVVSVKAGKAVHPGRADVLIDLDPQYVPLRSDARAMLRGKSIMGEAYVALSLGSGRARAIPEGGTLKAGQALTAVESDQIFAAYDKRTRAALREWMRTQAPGLAVHGDDLNAALGSLRPWMIDADRLLDVVQRQSADVQSLLRDGGEVANGLADREQSLRLLAGAGDEAFNAIGDQGESLAAAFRQLPGFEREATQAIDRLTRLARERTGQVASLRRELAPLSPALESLSADAPALRAVVEATPRLARASGRGLPALDRTLREAPPLLARLDPFLRSFNPALRYLAAGRSDLTGLVANLAAASQTATSTPNSSEPLHYLRAMPVLNPAALGPLSQRPGANRANAYPSVGAGQGAPAAYAAYDTGNCGNATPYITDEPSPWLDEAQREQIRIYAFGDRPADPPRPRCSGQNGGLPRLLPDPRLGR